LKNWEILLCGPNEKLQDFCGGIDGEPMIRAFMTVVWALHEETKTDDNKIRLIQTVHAHKTKECRVDSLRWWSRACNSDRWRRMLEESANGSATPTLGVGN
jgi:hypothetical protein